jgi:hypothetical protein
VRDLGDLGDIAILAIFAIFAIFANLRNLAITYFRVVHGPPSITKSPVDSITPKTTRMQIA